MIIVSDTSPIRGLIALNHILLLKHLFSEVYIPVAVETELRRIQSMQTAVNEFLDFDWVHVKTTEHSANYREIRKILDEGESEAIELALEMHADLLLMDENKGRAIAKEKGLKPLGLIGVLLRGKKLGRITLVKPLLDELIAIHGFWIDGALYKSILSAAGE